MSQLAFQLPSEVTKHYRDFLEYHRTHPEVYQLLVRFAREAKLKGRRKRYGIAAIFERARWHAQIEKADGEWKLNNNFRSYYARLIEQQEPDLKGFFEVRAPRSQ